MSVLDTDPRFEEWPERKPTAQERKVNKLIDDPVKVVRDEGSKAAVRAVQKVVTPARVAQVLPVIAKASLVGLAGFAAYWVTRKLQGLRFKTWDEMRYELSNAYRHARQAAALEAGRPLTAPELRGFKTWYDRRIENIDAAQRAGQQPRGFLNLTFGDD